MCQKLIIDAPHCRQNHSSCVYNHAHKHYPDSFDSITKALKHFRGSVYIRLLNKVSRGYLLYDI